MAESMLAWMKHHETRFQTSHRESSTEKSRKQQKLAAFNKSYQHENTPQSQTNSEQILTTPKNPQKTMDAFLPAKQSSDLFDTDFQMADFQLVTKRWKEKNRIEMAVN